MISLIERLLAASPVVFLLVFCAALWASSDDKKHPTWIDKAVTAALVVFIVLMTAGAVMTWGS